MNKLIVLDLVRLTKVRYSPQMIISSINEEQQTAICVWYDTKTRKTKTEHLPLNVLEIIPEKEPIIKEDLLRVLGYNV